MVAKDDKHQITAVLARCLKGDFFPIQIIYEGNTSRCLPAVKLPPDWHATFSENHWLNEETMHDYLVKILIPYIQEKRKNLQFSPDYPALVFLSINVEIGNYSPIRIVSTSNHRFCDPT